MGKKYPLVSIGMPVYNEASFLKDTLNSLINQTYPNIEILISDNASTDETEKICRRYSAIDKRITYHRNNENIGSIANFNNVRLNIKGKYFMWASGHDRWDKRYIEKCVEILEKNKKIVICHTQAKDFDPTGKLVRDNMKGLNILSDRGFERVHETISQLNLFVSYAVYGLIRTDILKKVRPFKDTYGSDHIFLIEMSYFGFIYQITLPLFYVTLNHLGDSSSIKQTYKRFSSPKKKHFLYLTQSRLLYNYLITVYYLNLPFFEKINLYFFIIKIFITKRFRRFMFDEVFRILLGEKTIKKIKDNRKTLKIKK